MSEQTQFTAEERRAAVGMSDLGAILGLDRYRSSVDIFLQFTGRAPIGDEEGVKPGPVTRSPLYWGQAIEKPIAHGFQQYMSDLRGETVVVRKDGRKYEKKDKRTQCHLDYRIVGEDSGVECKNPGSHWSGNWGEPHTDQIPETYLAQVHGQLWHVNALNKIYIPRLVGHEFSVYEVPRDPQWNDLLDDKVARFWWHVDNDKQPDFDFFHARIDDTIKLVYPGYNGEVVRLGPECDGWSDILDTLSTDRGALEKSEKYYKRQIRAAMGENSFGVLANGKVWKRSKVEVKAETTPRSGYTKDELRKTSVGRLPAAVKDLAAELVEAF